MFFLYFGLFQLNFLEIIFLYYYIFMVIKLLFEDGDEIANYFFRKQTIVYF